MNYLLVHCLELHGIFSDFTISIDLDAERKIADAIHDILQFLIWKLRLDHYIMKSYHFLNHQIDIPIGIIQFYSWIFDFINRRENPDFKMFRGLEDAGSTFQNIEAPTDPTTPNHSDANETMCPRCTKRIKHDMLSIPGCTGGHPCESCRNANITTGEGCLESDKEVAEGGILEGKSNAKRKHS